MKNKKNTLNKKAMISLISIFFLLSMPLILAENRHDTLTIKILGIEYKDLDGDSINDILTIQIDFNSSEDDFNDQIFIFDMNTTGIFTEEFLDIPYVVYTDSTPINMDYAQKYDECKDQKSSCEIEKGKLDVGYTKCNVNLGECQKKYEGENATKCDDELNICNLQIKERDLDLNAKNTEITNFKTEKENTKNSKYFWGIGGIIIGVLCLLFKEGKIGAGNPQDKSVGEFNKNQAG